MKNSKYRFIEGILLDIFYVLIAITFIHVLILGKENLELVASLNKINTYIIENRQSDLESVKLDEEKLNELCASYKYRRIKSQDTVYGYIREDLNGENSKLVGHTNDGYIVFICPEEIDNSELSLEELISYGYIKVGTIENVNERYTVVPNLLLLTGVIPHLSSIEAKDYSAVYYDEARHALGDAKTIGNLYEKYGKE